MIYTLYTVSRLPVRGGGRKKSGLHVKHKISPQSARFIFVSITALIFSFVTASPAAARDIRDGLFISADIQRYIAVSGLQDYTVPKPGWSAACGWTFPLGQYNELSPFFQSGHRVISGENPLVRTLDIVPFQLGAEWTFAPKPLFSFGVYAGAGFFYSKISHYETVIKMLTQELSSTTGFSAFFSAAVHAGIQLCDSSVQFKVTAGIECICETEGLVPVPAISFQTRVYPVRAFRHAKKPPVVVEVERVVEKEIEKEVVVEKERIVEVEKEVVVEVEKIVKVPVFPEIPPFPFNEDNTAVIYFNTKEDSVQESAVSTLTAVGAYLEAVPELTVTIEGNTAPFDSPADRYNMGLRRANAVRTYLLENFNIAARRINTTSAGSSRSKGIIQGAGNDAYTEFRIVRILLDGESLAAAKSRIARERSSENPAVDSPASEDYDDTDSLPNESAENNENAESISDTNTNEIESQENKHAE